MNKSISLGIDTSCYTTSVAAADKTGIVFQKKTMLFVQSGERGLRQSDGLFQHVRQLPDLLDALFEKIESSRIGCICVSAAPTEEGRSYMPVFLAGQSTARALSAALGVPLYQTTHQRGHVRAAQIGNEALLDSEKLPAFHLSGGTTDLLCISQEHRRISTIRRMGSSTDLHVGQFVDRVGVALGLPFPSGRELEELAIGASDRNLKIPSSVQGLDCSFSGAETKAQQMIQADAKPAEVAFAVYDCIARTLGKMIRNYRTEYGMSPILLGGGVASSGLLRDLLVARGVEALCFSSPGYAADNACGVALIGRELMEDG